MKKYAVQYAYHTYDVQIPVDTSPISYEEAVSLFNDNLDDFKYRLREGQRPELAIWEDVGDGEAPNYHKTLVHLDQDSKLTRGEWYSVKTVEDKIELPTL